jgi:hypothetical protein
MMDAGKRRKEAIKEASIIKFAEHKRADGIKRQADLIYKEAVQQATLRYRKELNGNKGGR